MYHSKLRRIVLVSLFTIVATALLSYILYQSRDFLGGPKIEITAPRNGMFFDSPLTTIEGSAINISHLELNGRKIFVDEKSLFSEKLLLLEGYNIITIKAIDRFNREVQKELELVLVEEKPLNEAVLEELPGDKATVTEEEDDKKEKREPEDQG